MISVNGAIKYLLSLRKKDISFLSFRMNNFLPSTFMSTSFGIIALELVNELSKLDSKTVNNTVTYFNDHQDSVTGLYIDPLIDIKPPEFNMLENNYLHLQTTAFILSSILALEGLPRHRFAFLDKYRKTDVAIKWMKKLNWKDPWSVSNDIMFFLQFLSFEYLKEGNKESLFLIYDCIDWLDNFQDKYTGFWGTDHGASIYNAMAGAFHIYIFYFFFKRKIFHQNKIVDLTLSLQDREGLFYPFGGGGSCEDLDAIDILIKFSMVTDYKLDKIKTALRKTFYTLVKFQNDDGGFSWARRPRFSVPYWIRFANPLHPAWNFTQFKFLIKKGLISHIYKPYRDQIVLAYSGWDKMSFNITESDIWSTWFRLLALAMINNRFNFNDELNHSWKFRNCPGLGWHDSNIRK